MRFGVQPDPPSDRMRLGQEQRPGALRKCPRSKAPGLTSHLHDWLPSKWNAVRGKSMSDIKSLVEKD
jgi:hypothetical protein